jgi:hypothetical protein
MALLRRSLAVHPRRQLRELYIFSTFFAFANSLILIFEPVFFYQQGVALALIAGYYGLHYGLYTLVLPFGGKFAARFGLERSLAVSMPLFVIYFLTLAVMPGQPGLFWIAWVPLTLFKVFYWPAYHAELIRFGDARNRGTEISWMFALTYGVGVLGPMIGGLVATYLGFPVLFVTAAALAVVATLPLLRTKERFQVQVLKYSEPWQLIVSSGFRRVLFTMIGWGENLVDLVFWPVFMFIVVGGADILGYIATINILLMTLLGFLIGEISDRFSRQRVVRLHLPFMALGYLLRPLASSPLRVLLTDSLAKASLIGVRIPQLYRLYAKGRRTGSLRFVLAMEISLSVTKCLLAFSLAVVFAVLAPYTAFTVTFVLGAVFALLYAFL